MLETQDAIWDKKGDAKRAAVQNMFAEIAPSYDRMNRIMSARQDLSWRRKVLDILRIQPGETGLDMCCGTGDFLPLIRDRQASAIGMDFCLPMLEGAHPKTDFGLALADACAIPMVGEAVDFVTVGWGIRNVPDIDKAHAEIFRVLKPGGRFASIDMAVPRNKIIGAFGRFVSFRLLPMIGGLFGHKEAYAYLPRSTDQFMSREGLIESMQRAGFVDCQFKDLNFGALCIHFGKKP